MGIDKIVEFAAGVVVIVALTGHLPQFTRMIHRAQAKLLWESQTSMWGNPNIYFERHHSGSRK